MGYNWAMGKRSIAVLLLIVILPLVIYFLRPSDEAKIKKLVKAGAEAVGKEDIEEIMALISFNYADDYGQSYMILKENLKAQFKNFSDIEVEYEGLMAEPEKDKARASMDLLVIASEGAQRGYIFGDLKKPVRFIVELEKGPTGKWSVTNAYGLQERDIR